MRKIFTLCSFLLCSTTVLAIDADFSKSFVIPETSGFNKVTIGGVDAIGHTYKIDLALREDLTLAVTDGLIQDTLSEKFEQSLRHTTWQGTYVINNDNLATMLNLVVVQDGYVGGEIIHSEPVEAGNSFLHARVTGDIITQYNINGSFIDEDRIDPKVLADSINTPTRQLIRVKRMRAIEFRDGTNGEWWQTNREYRLVLENGVLTGTVGIPNDRIGTNDGTSENGTITLTKQ